jgi:hypothetical protein
MEGATPPAQEGPLAHYPDFRYFCHVGLLLRSQGRVTYYPTVIENKTNKCHHPETTMKAIPRCSCLCLMDYQSQVRAKISQYSGYTGLTILANPADNSEPLCIKIRVYSCNVLVLTVWWTQAKNGNAFRSGSLMIVGLRCHQVGQCAALLHVHAICFSVLVPTEIMCGSSSSLNCTLYVHHCI